MKKTILALALIIMTFTASAQENNEKSFRVPSGYQGFLELGSARGLAYNLSRVNAQLSTTHGYQFNDKVFAGLGAGYNISYAKTEFTTIEIIKPDGRIIPIYI